MGRIECFVLRAGPDPDACVLDRFPTIRDYVWQATEGVAVGGSFPGGVELRMSERMGGKSPGDLVRNTLGLLIGSARVRAAMDAVTNATIEYVPLDVLDHRGRRVANPFFIINVLGTVDCVDINASKYVASAMVKGGFSSVERLVLDPRRLPADRDVFRVPEVPRLVLVSVRVADELRAAGLAGLELAHLRGPLEA